METKKAVIVTALYDIGRDGWDNYRVSYDHYFLWMKNTLSINCNMVIYTQDKFYDRIVDFRKRYDPQLNKTVVILISLEELGSYELYFDKLSTLMGDDNFKKRILYQVPEMTKPLYNIIMFNKVIFLQHTKNMGYFDSDLLIWVDAGGLRDNLSKYENQTWPSLEKIDWSRITFFCHTRDFNIIDNYHHSMSQMRHIQGTCFFVPSHMIDNLVKDFNDTISSCISSSYIGSDEKIFDITYCKDKSKYNLVTCMWRTYFDIFKYVKKIGDYKEIKIVTVTWGIDENPFSLTNENYLIEHFYFNTLDYEKIESDFSKKYGEDGQKILYHFYLLLDEVKKVNADYIIFCDSTQVTKIKEVGDLLLKFDSQNQILINESEKIILSSRDNFINMLQTILYQVLITNFKDFGYTSIFKYYHDKGFEPKIVLDSTNLLTLDDI